MRIKVLLFALWLFLSGSLALSGGTVSTTIQLHPGLALPTSIIACHDSLDVSLDITGMVPAEQIVFQGVAGSVIDPAIIVTGNFMPTINSDSITVANTMAGDGSVRFTVKLTDCALYNNQSASIAFNTYYPDSITLNQSASIVLLEPTLEITDAGLSTLPTHNCEYFLLNDVIKRYYKIKAHNGPIDAFSLEIAPQPGIEITSISAVGPDSAPVPKYQLVPSSANHFDFGATDNPINQCSLNPHLKTYLEDYDTTGDYILIEETIKITACTAPPGTITDCANPAQKTIYTAHLHCDQIFNHDPCLNPAYALNVNCVDRPTALKVELSDRADGFHPGDFSQSGGISFCQGAPGIDYTIYLENNSKLLQGDPPTYGVGGAGALLLKVIWLPMNREYFDFDHILIGNVQLDDNMYDKDAENPYPSNPELRVLRHVDSPTKVNRYYIIDLTKLTQDPNVSSEPNMQLLNQLTDSAGDHRLLTDGTYNLLPEGKYIKIVLKNFRFIGQDNFKQCDAPPYSLTSPTAAMRVIYQDMCNFNTPDLAPDGDGNYVYQNSTYTYTVPFTDLEDSPVWTRFQGYSYALSDTADIAPGNSSGQPESAHLTYTFLRTQGGYGFNDDDPLNLRQRGDWTLKVMKCPNLQYRAVIRLPKGFGIGSIAHGNSGKVKLSEPNTAVTLPSVTACAISTTADYTDWAVPYNGDPSVDDHHGGYITDPSQITLAFELTLTCGDTANGGVGKIFGFADIPVEFQALCGDSACPDVYRAFDCAKTEIFFHCPGFCAAPVGITNFSCNRITPGWSSPTAFANAPASPDLVNPNPLYENRVYETDVVEAIGRGGTGLVGASSAITGGILAFEMAYEPPAAGHNVFELMTDTANAGSFSFTPLDANLPTFSIGVLPATTFMEADSAHPKPILRVYGDVATVILLDPSDTASVHHSAQEWLALGHYLAEFKAHFRVIDDKPLVPGFNIIDQIRGQFIVVNAIHDKNELADCCDPWGDNLILLKTVAKLDVNYLIAPGSPTWIEAVDQCYLRYLVLTHVEGGFPVYDNFPGEYRPHFAYPNHIRFDIPAGYEFKSLRYGYDPSSIGTLTPIIGVTDTTAGGNGGYVDVDSLHANYPLYTSIDTVDLSKQALELTLRRLCPHQLDNPITITDFDLTTHAYCPDAAYHDHLITPPSQTISYTDNDPYDISLATVDTTIGNINPVTIPITLQHSGANMAGTGLENTWIYFTVNNPNSAPVTGLQLCKDDGGTLTLLTPTVSGLYQASGLYELGTLLNVSPIKLKLKVGFECIPVDADHQTVFKPVTVGIRYGNNCQKYPELTQTGNGQPYFLKAPCLDKSYSITILPQASLLSLTVDPPETSCGKIVFHVHASSPGADVHDAIFSVIPPTTGFTFDTAASSIETVAMTTSSDLSPFSANAWHVTGIPSILNHFGQAYFNVDTPEPYHALDFTLVYDADCSTPSGTYGFKFSLNGMSSCNIAVAAQDVLQNVSFSAEPTLVCAPSKTIRCDQTLVFDPPSAAGNCIPPPVISTVGLDVSTWNSAPTVCAHYRYTVTRTWEARDTCGHLAQCSQTITVGDQTTPVFIGHCMTDHYEAGDQTDNFTGPQPASPSAGFSARLNAGHFSLKGFDDCALNQVVAHTFVSLQRCPSSGITGARLKIRLKPCVGTGCDTDTVGLSFTDSNNNLLSGSWSRYLGTSGNAQPGLLANPWCGYTGGNLFTFDLAALPQSDGSTINLLPYLNQYGFLDFVCQENTSVDYLVLDVDSCCCPPGKTVECGSSWDFDVPTASGACDGTSATITDLGTVTGGTSCSQTRTKTWQATDLCGNIATCSQTVTVVDTIPPVVMTVPGSLDAALECSDVSGIAAALSLAPAAMDNCAASPAIHLVSDIITPGCGNSFTEVRTWNFTDGCGNISANFVQTITVQDTTKPMATQGTIAACYPDVASAEAAAKSATVFSDNCSLVTKTASTVGDCSATITVRGTDACGNYAEVTYATRLDNTRPLLVAGPIGACYPTQAAAEAAARAATTATDHCPGALLMTASTAGDCSAVITVTLSDGCGNSAAVTYATRIDNTPPVIAGCGNITVPAAAGQSGATVTFPGITAMDNCDGAVAPVCSPPSGWFFNIGSTVVSCTAADTCANQSTCTFTVAVLGSNRAEGCSLTQGFYGNPKGKFNGTPSLTLLNNLLAGSPLVVGKLGARSLTIPASDALTLQSVLPAGGSAVLLPNGGDRTLATVGVLLNKGRFVDILLGQTITLSLNLRLDANLSTFPLPASFCTQGTLPGLDGKRGTSDDALVAGDFQQFTIPASVLNALSSTSLGILNGKVQGLLELANRALAGLPTGGASLAEINAAVDAINGGFDECRVLVDCVTHTPVPPSANDNFGNPNILGGGGSGGNFGLGLLARTKLVSQKTSTTQVIRTAGFSGAASKEPGEPNIAGNAGGKSVWWRWLASQSGWVTIDTAGSSFDTLLGVYVGQSISNLTLIASRDDTASLVTAEVAFRATAGTNYLIAVDGYDGASGAIALELVAGVPRLASVTLLVGGELKIGIEGEVGRLYTIEGSTNLVTWTTVTTLENTSGSLQFVDPEATTSSSRFYRVVFEP